MKIKSYNKWITLVSIIIPIIVVLLFSIRIPNVRPLSFLPPIYATINALTAILLICALIAIRKGKQKLHKIIMKTCIVFSVLFLAMYVAYHMTSDATPYGGEGISKIIYLIILLTHILLSVVIIPLVLITFIRGWLGNYPKHKKIARITFPLWLYVTISGVIVYLMISPYYV